MRKWWWRRHGLEPVVRDLTAALEGFTFRAYQEGSRGNWDTAEAAIRRGRKALGQC
jgi:hypothetical protein